MRINPFHLLLSERKSLKKPTNKSDITQCLETSNGKDVLQTGETKPETITILDAAVIIHLLVPRNAKMFLADDKNLFNTHISRLFQNLQRIDLVFERYRSESLKADIHQSRGVHMRQI